MHKFPQYFCPHSNFALPHLGVAVTGFMSIWLAAFLFTVWAIVCPDHCLIRPILALAPVFFTGVFFRMSGYRRTRVNSSFCWGVGK